MVTVSRGDFDDILEDIIYYEKAENPDEANAIVAARINLLKEVQWVREEETIKV
jgi:hypothetical protein